MARRDAGAILVLFSRVAAFFALRLLDADELPAGLVTTSYFIGALTHLRDSLADGHFRSGIRIDSPVIPSSLSIPRARPIRCSYPCRDWR